MLHLDLFSGIGGFALAADTVWPGIKHVFCEIDPFCQAILKKHWPNSPIYGDIRTLTNSTSARQLRTKQLEDDNSSQPWGIATDSFTENKIYECFLLTGGFPCQPFSHAGKRKGTEDDRHLWPEMRRVIQEFSPRYVVAENVRGLLSIDGGLVFEQVCLDLEALGYEVQPFVIPACAVGAPHRRDRVWIVAHLPSRGEWCRECERSGQWKPQEKIGNRNCHASDTESKRQWTKQTFPRTGEEFGGNNSAHSWSEDWPQVAARLCRMDDGLPEGVARPRGWRNAALKAYGNAIVPQVAEQIFRAIKMTS